MKAAIGWLKLWSSPSRQMPVSAVNKFIRPLRSRLPELEAIRARAASMEQASEEILAFATSKEIAALVAKVAGRKVAKKI
jgi:hypothetical protein